MKSPRIISRLWRAYIGFCTHDGALVAASIAYYLALSFFPLMLVLLAVLAAVAQGTTFGQQGKQDILDVIAQQVSPALRDTVEEVMKQTENRAPTAGSIAFFLLVIASVALFVQVDYAFDRIWHLGVARKETWLQWLGRHVFRRLKALVMLVGVGAFLLTALVASVVWSGVQKSLADHNVEPRLSFWAGIGLNIALNYFALALVYKFVPKVRIKWREAFAASLVAAPLWEIGRQVMTIYFFHTHYLSAYKIIGSFLAIMLWAYYAMYIVLFGAEYVRVRQHERVEGGAASAKAGAK